MKQVILKPLQHRNNECIGIFFENNSSLNDIVRKLPTVKWSQSNRCWYIPLNKESYNNLYKALNEKASLNTNELKQFLEKRNRVKATIPTASEKTISKPVTTTTAWKLSKENLAALEIFIEQLKLKSYSPSTIRTYRNEFLQLLQLIKNKPVNELTVDDLRRYMVFAMEKQGINENTAHSRLNALKFYFEQVLKREKFFWEIPRPKKPLLLPKVLAENELGNLFKALTNIKHKAMLFTAYSAGLRVSEIAALKIKDIDSERMQIFITQAKGKKDRYVTLSPVLLDILRAYIKSYKPKPIVYLFESEQSGTAYPTRSI